MTPDIFSWATGLAEWLLYLIPAALLVYLAYIYLAEPRLRERRLLRAGEKPADQGRDGGGDGFTPVSWRGVCRVAVTGDRTGWRIEVKPLTKRELVREVLEDGEA